MSFAYRVCRWVRFRKRTHREGVLRGVFPVLGQLLPGICALFSHLAACRHGPVTLIWELTSQGGGERDMNYMSQVCEVGMMRFTLREDSEPEYLGRAAEEILQLPSVLRVRTNPARREIEITFKQPAEGLLRQVNNALRSVGTEMTASKVR